MRSCYVYILASHARRLYVGMTSNLDRRLLQHRRVAFEGAHSARYRVTRLVYFELASSRRAAAAREHQIKGWLRSKKVALIEAANPFWDDLAP